MEHENKTQLYNSRVQRAKTANLSKTTKIINNDLEAAESTSTSNAVEVDEIDVTSNIGRGPKNIIERKICSVGKAFGYTVVFND